MLRYFGTRILTFIPTLLIISIIAFGLSRMTPGDPVACGNNDLGETGLGFRQDPAYLEKIYEEEAKEKGLDRPYFYFSITSAAHPDTLYRILDGFERESLQKLINQYGNWPEISKYYHEIQRLEKALFNCPREHARDAQIKIFRNFQQLQIAYRKDNIDASLSNISKEIQKDSLLTARLGPSLAALKQSIGAVESQATPWRLSIPRFYWHGIKNQYHFWFGNFIQGDFGKSCRNGQPVAKRIKPALWWTLVLTIPALLLAFLIAIPLGVYGAIKRNSLFDRISTVGLFILFSLPSFWVATMLIVFFTTKEYGPWFDIFASPGLGDLPMSAPLWDRFLETLPHLLLPVFCMTYANLAGISRQMRSGVLRVIRQDYIRTARAKGLSSREVVWKHAFQNALFPLITMIAMVIPNLIAGSVVIEMIFNIPGMGRETLEAIFSRDWPVVFAILMLAGVLTLLGNLIGDLLYAWADPRISYGQRSR